MEQIRPQDHNGLKSQTGFPFTMSKLVLEKELSPVSAAVCARPMSLEKGSIQENSTSSS